MPISSSSEAILTPKGADKADFFSVNGDFYRLIPSRFPPVNVYDGIINTDRQSVLADVEGLTNPRMRMEERLRATGEATADSIQNWNIAPFAYPNPEGGRFFPMHRPSSELAADLQTALAVSVARREAFLSRTEEPSMEFDMRLFKTPIRAERLVDLRHLPLDLTREQRLRAGESVPEGADGAVYYVPERPSGCCVALLSPRLKARTVQATHYRFVWDGQRISKIYAFENNGLEIDPLRLRDEANLLAA